MVLSILIFCTIFKAFSQEDYSKWSHSQRILLNTSNYSGSNISGILSNFPILIRLNPGNFRFFSQTRDKGADIRFAKPDGTHVPYQIERWDDKTGDNDTAEIWVKIDTLFGNSIAQSIVLFWGNSSAGDSSNSGNVFDTTSYFNGIWHMNESSDTLFDGTKNRYNATRSGDMKRAAGEIGYGQTLDGTGDYADIGNVLNPGTSNVTVSAWVKRSASNKWQTIVTKTNGGNPSSTYGWHFCFNTTNNLVFYIASGGASWGDTGTYKHTTSKSISDTAKWHHVAAVINRSANSSCKMYIDGIDSSGTVQGDISSVSTVSNLVNARIGAESDNGYPLSGILDEIMISNTARSANWIKLCYENQKPAQTLVKTSGRLWWDSTASSGIQVGSGTWGTNANWSLDNTDGRALISWPGAGYTAVFGGSSGGYTVTVTGTQLVDCVIFTGGTCTLNGGTLSFGSTLGVIILSSEDVSLTIGSAINGSAGLAIYGGGGTGTKRSTLRVSGKSSYTGVTTLSSHIDYRIDSLLDGGKNSSLGASSSAAANLVLDDAVLQYTGGMTSTDRLFTVTTKGASLYSSGSGALSFTNDSALVFSGSGNHTLEFGGEYTGGPNTFAPLIKDGTGGVTSVTKTGKNIWIFTGTHTYTGATKIQNGLLIINGSVGEKSTVTVADSATIAGSGMIRGMVDVAGIIAPGSGSTGKLRTGALTLRSSSILNFELGSTASDSLVINGDLILDGTLNVDTVTGFTARTCQLISWSGKLTDNKLSTGMMPAKGKLLLTDSTLSITFADTLITDTQKVIVKVTSQPVSQSVTAGDSTRFSVTATGEKLTYAWKKTGTDSTFSNKSTFIIHSALLSDSGRYFCVVSDSAMSVSTDTVTLTVVRKIVVNPLTVTAQRLESKNVRITISNIDKVDIADPAPAADSIGLWILAGSLPESIGKATLCKTYGRSRITGTVLIDTIKMPESNSLFGIMTGLFWNDGTVSAFQPGNGTTVDLRDTLTIVDTSIAGCIGIKYLHFDSLRASLRISWCVDTGKYNGDLDVGIAYSLAMFPSEMSGKQIVKKLKPCTDTVVQLNESLLFDTLYYVTLFIRKPGTNWIASGDSAKGTVRTGKVFRQMVTYFDIDVTNDSVPVFNGQVVLWKDSTIKNTIILTDTVQVYKPKLPDGFIAVGMPVSFLKAMKGIKMFIGFHVKVPDKYRLDDVRIFRDSAGMMLVEYGTISDPATGMIYMSTSDARLPFVPMIDTRPFGVIFKTDTSTVATPDQNLSDLAEVVDNVANVRWWYLYSKADEHPVVRDSGIFRDTSNLCNLLIPTFSRVVNSDLGLRALFVVSDGSFIDTFDLSRSVLRKNSDPFVTVSNRWQPLYPTAELDHTDPDSLIIAAICKDKKYDPRYLLLFRWVGVNSNRDEEQKWIEYNPEDPSIRSLFTLDPGKLLWLKTKANVLLSLGSAKTLSLKDTFSIKLPPGDFTDFGMPYRFDVTVQDIIASSGSKSEQIQYMSWYTDKITGQYKCEIVYAAGMSGYTDASVPLGFTPGGGYCFYNPLQDTVVLRIPPSIAKKEGVQKLSKKTTENWCARLVAKERSGYTFPVLNFGYAAGLEKNNYPVPPSFNEVCLYFYDRDCNMKQAHYLSSKAADGVVKELRITNNSDSVAHISFQFETAGQFPKGYATHLFDNSTKEFRSEGMVEVPAKTSISHWVTVGDENLRSRFLSTAGKYTYNLNRIYPNPAHGIVNISYSIPMGADNFLHISIFDLQGREVWNKKITHLQPEGNHAITWNGKSRTCTVGAGMYVVSMSVVSPKGKTLQRFDRCITYLP
jgi:autotransporter-associated beta strand protein